MLTCVLVFVLICETIEEEAVWTSESVANDPESSPAPVRVRVTDDQTAEAVSATNVPNEVSVRPLDDQTAPGSVANKLDEADKTVALVLAFTRVTIEEEASLVCVLVFAFTRATTEVEALLTWVLVFVLICETIDEEAVCIAAASDDEAASVTRLTALVTPDV